jgi:HEAT repeat protein
MTWQVRRFEKLRRLVLLVGVLTAALPVRATCAQSDVVQLAIDAIRDLNPSTPDELLAAVRTSINLDQPEVAKQYLQALVDLQPNEEVLVQLYRKFGAGLFLQLSRESRLSPLAKEFAQRVLEAAEKAVTDPQRISRLVAALQDDSRAVRNGAISGLRDAGSVAVAPILDASSTADSQMSRRRLLAGLFGLGKAAVDPLLGALDAGRPSIRADAMTVLGWLEVHEAIPRLIRPAFDSSLDPVVRRAARDALHELLGSLPAEETGKRVLSDRVSHLLSTGMPDRADFDGQVAIWRWDAQAGQSAPVPLPARDAAASEAARLAADLYALEPTNRDYQRLYLTAQLTAARLRGGLDSPLSESAKDVHRRLLRVRPETIESVLADARRLNRIPAAIAAAELLGDIGDQRSVADTHGARRPLTAALLDGDARVRFAAAEAIVKIGPRHAYRGAADLIELLNFILRTEGSRRVLLVHSRPDEAALLASLARSRGFEADVVSVGRDALKHALAHPDFELLLISDAINFPRWTELVQQFRRDWRTSRTPIGLIARAPSLSRADGIAARDGLTEAFPMPQNEETLDVVFERLLKLRDDPPVGPAVRLRQATAALDWSGQLAGDDSYGFYEFLPLLPSLESALLVPDLSKRAARVLGRLGTPRAQYALADFASQVVHPLRSRQAAAAGLEQAIQRRGVQLTSTQILRQYDRYNSSADLDAETQAVMGAILDSIEKPTAESRAARQGSQ